MTDKPPRRRALRAIEGAPPGSPTPMPDADRGHTTRTATVLIAVTMMGVVIWWLHEILAPLALALFLMVIIDGFARVLRHRIPGFPKPAALPVALILTTLAFGVCVYVLAENAGLFIAQLIADAPKLNGVMARIASRFGVEVPPTVDDLIAQIDLPQYLASVANALKSLAAGATLVFIYLIFLFVSRSGFEPKARQLFKTPEGRQNASRIFMRIRTGVERYVWVQTFVGLIIAALSWALMALVGLNNAVFWAFLIFIAIYVPILGSVIGILLPPLFALAQFDTYWQAVTLLIGAEAIHFTVGNFVAPRMQGVALNVDPVAVVLSLALWGTLWGVPGMFLSTPFTVVAIVVLMQFRSTRWIAVLLSRDGDPEAYSEGSPDLAEPIHLLPPKQDPPVTQP
jgi:predicted PurR-regulated permease PerM